MNNIILKEANSAINQFDFAEVKLIDIVLSSDIQSKENGLDQFLSDFVNKHLSKETFDNIILPISIGRMRSDFIGLRLAFHIRTTSTVNQCSNIYVYGSERIENIWTNELSKIFFTSGVSLIDYSKSKIIESLNIKKKKLRKKDLASELGKIHISIPKNYYDNHGIANEWGVYQLARNANINIEDISDFHHTKLNILYFKWLIAKNKLDDKLPEEEIKEQKAYGARLKGIKIVGNISDYKKN